MMNTKYDDDHECDYIRSNFFRVLLEYSSRYDSVFSYLSTCVDLSMRANNIAL